MAVVSRVELAERIIRLRTEKMKLMSQNAMAKLVGVAVSTYRQWESGHMYPSIEFLYKLCVACEVTLDELLVKRED